MQRFAIGKAQERGTVINFCGKLIVRPFRLRPCNSCKPGTKCMPVFAGVQSQKVRRSIAVAVSKICSKRDGERYHLLLPDEMQSLLSRQNRRLHLPQNVGFAVLKKPHIRAAGVYFRWRNAMSIREREMKRRMD